MRPIVRAAAGVALAAAIPAHALPDGWIAGELATDHRRRGLSWSDGQAGAELSGGVQAGPGLRLDGSIVSLRGSARHGGADAVVDLGFAATGNVGAVRLDAGVTGHVFAGGRGRLDFLELTAGAGTLVGPVAIDLTARYAPDQAAIGGDNLHMGLRSETALIGTPVTIHASVGRSMGSVDDPIRAARIRPGGSYTDWSLGADHVTGPLTIGIAYVGNDARAPRMMQAGIADTIVARLRVGL